MKGDPTLCKSQASWKAMMKALNNEGEIYMLAYLAPIEKSVRQGYSQ